MLSRRNSESPQRGAETRFETRLYRRNRPVMHLLFEATRRLGPVVRIPRVGHVINDPDVARAILLDPEAFNSHDLGSFGALITEALGPDALINMDGPAHQRFKRELLQVFSNRYIMQMIGDAAEPMIERLRVALLAGKPVDFAAFMREYGCAVACELIGVAITPGDEQRAYDDIFWLATEIMAFAGSGRKTLRPQEMRVAQGYAKRLYAYIEASYNADSGANNSVTQRLRAQGLDFDTVKDLVSVVLVGATELVIYGLPRALAVMVDSGAFAAVQNAPERLDDAIDEALRLTTPSNVILRAVSADRTILGHHFRKGDRALIAFRNIMRSTAYFEAPDRFDLDRVIPTEMKRLPFGAGLHTCLGTALTLAEMRQVLGALVALPGTLSISARSYNRGKLYPGYTQLLIGLDSTAAR